jgi:2-deoxy-scyllo-inosamine dehydrogenase (SAM-dependent)
LSTVLVHDVLDALGRFGFSTGKYLAFHLYNEPLLDPRLLSFVQRARANCHDISVILWTNGWHLRPRNAMGLVRSGVTNFMVSAYSDEEFDRLFNLGVWLREKLAAQPPPAGLPVYFRVRRSHSLDGRMRASVPISAGNYAPCSQPWSDLIIRASGSIGLCCYDWREQKTFGNLNGTRFEDCLAGCRRELDTLQDELSAGIRTLPVCQACQFPRWPAGERAGHTWREGSRVFG